MAKPAKKVRRMFIDPASKATGWALFEDTKLIDHGSISVDEGEEEWTRLTKLQAKYHNLLKGLGKVDEIHIEKFWRSRMAEVLHWSVAAIGMGCWPYAGSIKQDVLVRSWQTKLNYNKKSPVPDRFKKYVRVAGTTDELEAILMGVYWMENRV